MVIIAETRRYTNISLMNPTTINPNLIVNRIVNFSRAPPDVFSPFSPCVKKELKTHKKKPEQRSELAWDFNT